MNNEFSFVTNKMSIEKLKYLSLLRLLLGTTELQSLEHKATLTLPNHSQELN